MAMDGRFNLKISFSVSSNLALGDLGLLYRFDVNGFRTPAFISEYPDICNCLSPENGPIGRKELR